jgi:hypothetical protein
MLRGLSLGWVSSMVQEAEASQKDSMNFKIEPEIKIKTKQISH